jgi:uncharacterized protein (TIGR03663 family)
MSLTELAPGITRQQPETINDERPFALTLEQVLYLLIFLASLLLHLWQLDGRALHHDETLHAAYSWNIFTGQPYIHDPLLHGPFLYYFGALMYFLFGDNDFTARLGFALFGTLLTVLPYLIRREIGRPAALLASLYLLISPAFLYMGRFARHDIYSITFEMLIFIAIVRYATTHHARWLYLGAAAFGLMFVNQETSYLFLLIIGLPLMALFLWRVFKPAFLILAVMAVSVAALIFVLPGEPEKRGGNVVRDDATGQIQVETPGPLFGWGPLETSDNSYALRIRNRSDTDAGQSIVENINLYFADLWKFFHHPAVLSAISVFIGGMLITIWLIWFQRSSDGKTPWQRAATQGNGIIQAYASLAQHKRWLIAVAIFVGIYLLFFTAMLTNLLGSITGLTGSLLYWLAQHDVKRGGQPLHYYLMLLVVYEPLVVLWSIVGLVLVAVDSIQRWRKPQKTPTKTITADKATEQPAKSGQHPPTLLLPLLLAWWSIAALLIYTWAGEKMPWLIVHILLPMTLFGSWACQRILFGQTGHTAVNPFMRSHRILLVIFLGIFLTTSGLNFVVINTYVGAEVRTNVPGLILLALTSILFLMVIIAAGLNWGWRWSFSVLALCITLFGGIYSMRSSYRLAYVTGDVPREMLIYTQTSPDVHRMVRRLEEISIRRTNGLHMPVMYDNETVWTWYLRDFTNAQRTGPSITKPGDDIMAVLILQENLTNHPQNRQYLEQEGFVLQRFPLRWWFPESETYRLDKGWNNPANEPRSLLAKVLRQPFNDETLISLWEFLIYRDPGAPLGSTDFVIAVRPEIADQMGWGIGADLQYE